jgi:hypothetical protein
VQADAIAQMGADVIADLSPWTNKSAVPSALTTAKASATGWRDAAPHIVVQHRIQRRQ